MIRETSLELTSGVKETQTLIARDLSSQGKNIDIDPKEHIVNVMGNITMAKGAATARKNFNSQLYIDNAPARKQPLKNIKSTPASSQLVSIIETSLAAQQQLPSKIIKKRKLRFLKEKKDKTCLNWEIYRLKQEDLRDFISSDKKKAAAVAKLDKYFDALIWDQIALQRARPAPTPTVYIGRF